MPSDTIHTALLKAIYRDCPPPRLLFQAGWDYGDLPKRATMTLKGLY